MTRKLTTISLEAGALARLSDLAAGLGFRQTRGPGAGELGSVSQWANAHASGELVSIWADELEALRWDLQCMTAERVHWLNGGQQEYVFPDHAPDQRKPD
jgi:hypothetical protein